MKTRADMISERPSGRLQDNKKSRAQLRERTVKPEGRRLLVQPKRKPAPAGEEYVCLYCGEVFRQSAQPTTCQKCATPF